MKNIKVSALVNIILAVALIAVIGFGWFYIQRVNPVSNVIAQFTPGASDNPPKYLYAITGVGKDSLRTPNQAIVIKNRIYIADSGNSRIVVYDYNGAKLFEFKKLDGKNMLDWPYGMAVFNNQLLVADVTKRNIAIFDLDGNFINYFAKKIDMRPTNIEVTNQNIFVSDISKHRILKFDLTGNLIAEVGKAGEGPENLNYPHGLKVIDNKLFVADANNYRMKIYAADTLKQIDMWDKTKDNMLEIPRGVAYDNSGYLWVSNMLALQVVRYDLNGKRDMVLGYGATPEDKFGIINGLAIDNNKRLYIVDRGLNKVLVFQIQ